jgi:hypothetical protein
MTGDLPGTRGRDETEKKEEEDSADAVLKAFTNIPTPRIFTFRFKIE